MPSKIATYTLKGLKILLISVVGLLGLLFLALSLPQTQDLITKKVEAFLEEKLGDRIAIGKIRVGLVHTLHLEEVYVKDLKADTLLYVEQLDVMVNLPALLQKKVEINEISLTQTKAYIKRTQDAFNFDYIVEAFSSEEDTTTTSQPSAWGVFMWGEIALTKVHFKMEDALSGLEVDTYLGSFTAELDQTDLIEQIYRVEQATMAQSHFKMFTTPVKEKQAPPPTEVEESTSVLPTIEVGKVVIQQGEVYLKDKSTAQTTALNITKMEAVANEIDLNQQRVDLERITIQKTSAAYHTGIPNTTTTESKASQAPADEADGLSFPYFGWQLATKTLTIQDSQVAYHDDTQPRQPGFDYAHIDVQGLQLLLEDFTWKKDQLGVKLEQLAFKDTSGFTLKNFQTALSVTNQQLTLQDFSLQTDQSKLQQNLQLSYQSFAQLQAPTTSLDYEVEILHISPQEVKQLLPVLAQNNYLKQLNNPITLQTKVKGTWQQLQIEAFTLEALSKTTLSMEGTLQEILQPERLQLDITTNTRTHRQDIQPWLSGTSLNLPEWLTLTASYRGGLERFAAEAQLITTLGDVKAAVNKQGQRFKVAAQTEQVHLGKILGDTSLTTFSSTLEAEGNGFDIAQNLQAQVEWTIQQFGYQRYNYKDIVLAGKVKQQSFEGTLKATDPNLQLDSQLAADFNRTTPVYSAKIDLEKLDLKALQLSASSIEVATKAEIAGEGIDLQQIQAKLHLDSLEIYQEAERLPLNYVHVDALRDSSHAEVTLASNIIQARAQGDFPLSEAPVIHMQRLFNQYFPYFEDTTRQLPPVNFDLDIHLENQPATWALFLPDLTTLQLDTIHVDFNSQEQQLSAKTRISEAVYGTQRLKNLQLNIDNDPSTLTGALTIDRLQLSDSLQLNDLALTSQIQAGLLRVNFTKGKDEQQDFNLGGSLKVVDPANHAYHLHLSPEQLINGLTWQIPADNYIRFGDRRFETHHFRLAYQEQQIEIDLQGKDQLQVIIEHLDLGFLTKELNNEDTLARGIIEGKIQIDQLLETPLLDANIVVEDFQLYDYLFGDISLVANNKTNVQRYQATLKVKGAQNDLRLKGFYQLDQPEAPLDFVLAINKFELKAIEMLSSGALSDGEGHIEGKLKVTGIPAEPDLDGQMHFEQSKVRINMFNTLVNLPEERIRLDKTGMHFDEFTILDSLNNPIKIDGDILTKNYLNFDFNLDISADNFTFLNSTREDNDTYFGVLIADVDASIRGNERQPIIRSKLKVDKRTDLTYVYIPSEFASVERSNNVVRFVDKSHPKRDSLLRKKQSKPMEAFLGISLEAALEVEQGTHIKALLDPYRGDEVSVEGGGNLSLQMTPQGDMSLTGLYEISTGYYKIMLYEVIRKEFTLVEGSSVSWSGNPYEPLLNLRAKYEVESPSYNLVANQIESDEADIYRVNQLFWVYLNLEGRALRPDIDFDLTYPEEARINTNNSLIQAKVKQLNEDESELNKQVFALLVLNNFIAESAVFNTTGGGDWQGSVSELLNAQLNKLSDRYIKGVDVSVGVDSYEEVDQQGDIDRQTDLSVNVKKSLLDNRVSVSVGGTFGLDQQEEEEQQAQSLNTDIVIEYKITPDGRYKLRVFNLEKRAMTTETVNASGVSIIFTRDFRKFKDLFRKEDEE